MRFQLSFILTLLTFLLTAATVKANHSPHPATPKIRSAGRTMYEDPLGSKQQLLTIRQAYPHLPDTLQSEYWVTLSTCYGMLHQYDSAIHLALKAQALKMNETTRVFALKTLGSLYLKSNQLEKADSVFQVTFDQASKRPRSEILQAILLGEWSNVFLNRSDYERTIKMLKKAMKLCAQAPKRDPETELILQSKMADTYRISEQLTFAERSFLDILNSPDSILRKAMRGNIMLSLNEVWQKQERYRESDSILLQALPLFESLNNLESIGYTQAMMAKNMLFRGNTRGGLVLMKSAYPKIRSTQSTTLLEIGALYLRMLRPYGLDNPEAHQLINDTLIQSLQKNNCSTPQFSDHWLSLFPLTLSVPYENKKEKIFISFQG
jgi:tetratricopeptide (TPR) repeat protein